jgi:hypothetical protein
MVDTLSEERVRYAVSAAGTLSRIVGAQNLPLLSDVVPGGLRLRYLDGDGVEIVPTRADLPAATRMITFEVVTRAGLAGPGVRMTGGARLLNR